MCFPHPPGLGLLWSCGILCVVRNAPCEWLKSFRPTGREVAWFAVCLVITGALFLGARRYLVFPVRPRVLAPADQTTFQLGPPESPEAVRTQAPIGWASDPKADAPPADEVPAGWSESDDFLDNWKPDVEGRWGDARKVSLKEVRWLQQQLARIKVMQALSPNETFARVAELARWVGQIPYRVKYHGWGRPENTVALNEGDCQDKSRLLAEALIAAGVTDVAICRGVPPGYRKGEPGHAWVQVVVGGDVWRIEATSGHLWRANTGSPLDAFEPVVAVWRPTS
jgi:transglutaminase-like putative cysteine protease